MDARAQKIDEILIRLKALWIQYPQLRLAQLIGNVFGKEDIYHIHDSKLMKDMEKFYANLTEK